MALENLVFVLRALAADAAGASTGLDFPGEFAKTFKLAMEQNARAFTAAADHIEAEQKRFAEHLEAWRVNNQTHAARIAELERALGNAIVLIDGDEYDITDLVDVRDGAPK